MADIKKFLPKVFKVEGGFVNDPDDAGGATNKGITLATFRRYYGENKTVADLKAITTEEAEKIYKDLFWDKCKADKIESQSVAELLVDYAVNSGVKTAAKKIQILVNVEADGAIGPKTLQAINEKKAEVLFNELHDVRVAYYKAIVAKKPSQQKFLKGWLNRLKTYEFES